MMRTHWVSNVQQYWRRRDGRPAVTTHKSRGRKIEDLVESFDLDQRPSTRLGEGAQEESVSERLSEESSDGD